MTQYQPHTPNRTLSRGFTLVELMVTIAVMGIIAAMAAPSMSRAMADQRMKSTVNSIESALKDAKAESTIRHQKIVFVVDTGKNEVVLNEYDSTKDDFRGNVITSYTFNKNIKVKYSGYGLTHGTGTAITIEPGTRATSRQTGQPATLRLTVCDKSISSVTPRQISISQSVRTSQTDGGSCS